MVNTINHFKLKRHLEKSSWYCLRGMFAPCVNSKCTKCRIQVFSPTFHILVRNILQTNLIICILKLYQAHEGIITIQVLLHIHSNVLIPNLFINQNWIQMFAKSQLVWHNNLGIVPYMYIHSNILIPNLFSSQNWIQCLLDHNYSSREGYIFANT